jgi:hypothetical protein
MKNILTLTLVFASQIALAQWYIGGRSGITLSNYKSRTSLTEVSNKGIALGVSAYKLIKAHAGVHIGLDYVEKGYQHQVCSTISDRLETAYLEMPFMFDYSFPLIHNFRCHARAGGYAAYWMTARYKAEGYDGATGKFDFKKNQAKRFDYGPSLGLLIDYTLNNSKLGVEVKYEIGMMDMQDTASDNTRNVNRTWLIGIVYLLPLTR